MKKKPPVGLIVLALFTLVTLGLLVVALGMTLQATATPTRPAQTYVLPGTSNLQMSGCTSGGACATLCWDGEAFVTCPE